MSVKTADRVLFPTTIAGSLPKPAWLAVPNQLWAPWRLEGDALDEAKDDATLLALKVQEDHRTAVRNNRRDVNEQMKKMRKDQAISADDEKPTLDDIQKLPDACSRKLEDVAKNKEQEIMKV